MFQTSEPDRTSYEYFNFDSSAQKMLENLHMNLLSVRIRLSISFVFHRKRGKPVSDTLLVAKRCQHIDLQYETFTPNYAIWEFGV